ncbi:Gtr1/RagA G protein conserved region [Fasciolopsis buskii]|uniref:Gtr1/RagA G protein conserved region n=1 Tax=Fasciolopsis buskii TaxID=27845 RepID=A0A8E0S5M1_9TREM|nr:Gtr1/RagA G protein conserved region [Fasciolopsis buski]
MTNMRKKVLLMGKSGSGKTSMRSMIFANYIARDTRTLGPTMEVEHTHVRLLGGLVLNLWDCGGQEGFMESYFVNQRESIFRNVEVLIYVFDIESREIEKDFAYYESCLEAVNQNSPGAKIFCLIHKTDLVSEKDLAKIFEERREHIQKVTSPVVCSCFATSIWNESLFKAWSKIVYELIPNVKILERSLKQLCEVLEADEVILFERDTFLEIACHSRSPYPDEHRFDKISNIIKHFKLSCAKVGANFTKIELHNQHFSAFIDLFTSKTYIMVICSDPSIASSAILLNIRNARKHFERLEKLEQPHSAIARR